MRHLKTIATLAVMGLATASAFAHSHPKTMSPDKDSTGAAPKQVSIEFSEGLEAKFSSLSVLDAKGVVMSKSPSVLDPADNKHMTLALPALSVGTYTVHWVTSSLDGHKLTGDYSFTVK